MPGYGLCLTPIVIELYPAAGQELLESRYMDLHQLPPKTILHVLWLQPRRESEGMMHFDCQISGHADGTESVRGSVCQEDSD